MKGGAFQRILFVVYCVEAGSLLLLAPWGGVWDRIAFELFRPPISALVLQPFTRSAVSGFGLLHLVWAAHDLELLLSRRANRGQRED